jgi:hypothetical protein
MRKPHFFLVFFVVLACSSISSAQAVRTWVSQAPGADDANPCSRSAPCRTFAGAISKTAINGEIDPLDPGSYGPVTISKSLTIDGGTGSGWASILASGTTGVTINLTDTSGNDPRHTVRLRNLNITGTGLSGSVGHRTGITGVHIVLATGAVYIENMLITDFTERGISDERDSGKLYVNDTTVRHCAQSGIGVVPATTTTVTGILDNVRSEGNKLAGFVFTGGAKVTVRNCLAFGNAGQGLDAEGAGTEVNMENCLASQNGTGIQTANSTPTVRISLCTVTNNTTGLAPTAGAILTYGNNHVTANGTDGAPTGPVPLNPV